MDGNAGQPRPAAAAAASQSGLIRPEQVARLPQLNVQQKQQYQTLVNKLWEVMNGVPQTDPRYRQAHDRLVATSRQLMDGMKQWRAANHPAQAQAQAQAQAAAAAAGHNQQAQQVQQSQQGQLQSQQANGATTQPQMNNVTFSQLLPEIQQKVNEQRFFFPPATVEGTKAADDWLREAKARYGQALQRAHMAKTKKLEFQRTFEQRQAAGNPLTQQEREVYSSKLNQCQKAIQESSSFMEKFKIQQAEFQRQQAQQRFTNQGIAANASADGAQPEQAVAANVTANAQGAPNAHSISSAVNAARTAAALAAQHAGSPPHGGSAAAGATPTAQNPMSTAQSPIHTQNSMDHSRPSSAHPSQAIHSQSISSQTGAPHAHPLNAVNGIKPQGPAITKNLQVAEPKPVAMPPSRPTLNGGAGVGLPGQLAQPALTALPGYVLETSEDGRVLSKKKLTELVREVCGPGPEDQLTPEAEEIFLQVADDFVDDLISASCKLAKLRGANHLESRDIQVVLERQYNIRIPGFSTDEVRTVRRPQPAAGWAHKMSAVQAAKLTGGGSAGQALSASVLNTKD